MSQKSLWICFAHCANGTIARGAGIMVIPSSVFRTLVEQERFTEKECAHCVHERTKTIILPSLCAHLFAICINCFTYVINWVLRSLKHGYRNLKNFHYKQTLTWRKCGMRSSDRHPGSTSLTRWSIYFRLVKTNFSSFIKLKRKPKYANC